MCLQKKNNFITVTVMTSSINIKEGTPLKGRTELAREFKIK
jgi:hypothetical protein